MTLRNGHGSGAGVPRIEVLPVDELPAGVPGAARPAASRDDAGRFVPGAGTSALARQGARAAHESRQLAALLGLWTPPEGHAYAPYARIARDFRDQHMTELAASVGGGQIGSGPASIISTAALQVAGSRWLYDQAARTGDAKLFGESSRLGDASRQNLLAAHELAAREAKARPKPTPPWLLGAPESADDDADDAEPDQGDEEAPAPDVGGAATESEGT